VAAAPGSSSSDKQDTAAYPSSPREAMAAMDRKPEVGTHEGGDRGQRTRAESEEAVGTAPGRAVEV
jgi:hypothetical protein